MSEWLDLMLEEIARKRREAAEGEAERRRRESPEGNPPPRDDQSK
jgi:hypothetical protein